MSAIGKQLSIAASAVLEAIPNQFEFQGPSAVALTEAIRTLATEVELLVNAVWGFDDHNGR